MENSSSQEASDGVLKSDCNNILPDLNATLLDASVDSPPPQKRSKGKPYEYLNSYLTLEEAFESLALLPLIREHQWTKHSIKSGKSFAIKYWFPCRVMKCPARVQIHNSTDSQFKTLLRIGPLITKRITLIYLTIQSM